MLPETGPPVAHAAGDSAGPERSALWVSIWVSLAIAAAALMLGVTTGTRIIVFDGAYMGIGLLLSIASVRAATASRAGPSSRFPFGRDALTPFVVLIQGLAIAGTLLYAAGDAIVIIRAGGSPVDPVIIAIYGAGTAAAGFAMAIWLKRRAPKSDLVVAESAQWRAGAVLSTVMLVGALAAAFLTAAGLQNVADYVDPALVLVSCLLLAYIPFRLMSAGLNELLEGAPSQELKEKIAAAIESVRVAHELPEPLVRAGKVGNKLYVEVDFTVIGDEWNIAGEDIIRRSVEEALSTLGLDVWAYVALTSDPTLFE
ncbi:cation transporter [Microbacterium sp. DT81.1]|uniref:cation transporter n=1 Tax=Microbacterium sp. DT81.1 TaxID=3393413 RepID=UPI003CEE9FE3